MEKPTDCLRVSSRVGAADVLICWTENVTTLAGVSATCVSIRVAVTVTSAVISGVGVGVCALTMPKARTRIAENGASLMT